MNLCFFKNRNARRTVPEICLWHGFTGIRNNGGPYVKKTCDCADRDYVYAGFNRLRRRKEDPEDKNAPVVYFTKDISAGGLMKVYKALGQEKKGKVAVKVSFGAEGEQYLDPILMAELMKETQGTFVDTNGFTAPRNTTKGNYAMAEKHGFTKVGPVDVLDADGDIDMPVQNGVLRPITLPS